MENIKKHYDNKRLDTALKTAPLLDADTLEEIEESDPLLLEESDHIHGSALDEEIFYEEIKQVENPLYIIYIIS